MSYWLDSTSTGTLTGITISATNTDRITIPSGAVVSVVDTTDKSISPRLYFNFVKTKFKKTEIEKIKQSIEPLTQLIANAKEVGQTALYEELLTRLANVFRIQEAVALNVTRYVRKDDIDRFLSRVRGRTIDFTTLDKYPRPIPANIRGRITYVTSRKVFDEYWVLFNNPNRETVKTNKDKIVEKDPILFGKFVHDPNRYYHIVSWEDEYCDLTLDRFVDELNNDKVSKEYNCKKIPKLTSSEMDMIKKEVIEKHIRLQQTRQSNFRYLAREEETQSLKSKVGKLFNRLATFWSK